MGPEFAGRTGPSVRIVALGGGTGLSRLLSGLKHRVCPPRESTSLEKSWWISDLTAIVTVSDDGGSSGRLRKELSMPPPGDIRNCLVALSESEPLLSQLFQHRFSGKGDLKGHSFGNLFLAAMSNITGDFAHAVQLCSQVLAIRGRIFPATMDDVQLVGVRADGTEVSGESNITRSPGRKRRIRLVPSNCKPVPDALKALRRADIITIGPGSLLTSVLPNLLVDKVSEVISQSPAVKIFINNIMTQPGETDGFSAADHVKVINTHVGHRLVDAIIVNSKPITPAMRAKYKAQGAEVIKNDRQELQRLGVKVYAASLASGEDVLRHDAGRLTQIIGRVYYDFRIRNRSSTAIHRFPAKTSSIP